MKSTLNIVEMAKQNANFREVVDTGEHSQLVLMSLLPGEEIGEEVHKVDQILFVAQGQGQKVLEGAAEAISENSLIFVKAGTKHNIINGAETEMKLFTIYAPPQHRPGTVHKTKAEAEADELDHY